VNPTSVMGASKRLSELVVRAQADGSGTSFSIVRFGNVLGSNGSVVPRFMEQIRKGGPVTITHPEMRRFFMLIPEAVQLVLHAASHAESGATYILEMGEQVRLVDMARDMIRLAGLSPDDIKIKFIGMRPGEKLSEELFGPDEEVGPSTVDKVQCVRGRWGQGADFLAQIESLEGLAARGRNAAVIAAMKDLVGMGVQPEVERAERPVPRVVSVFSAPLDPVCPSCTSGRLLRSRTRTIGERVRKEFTADRPYRCDSCEWRGWLAPPRVGAQTPVDPLPVPDLSTLDHATPTHAVDRRGSFSPRDLR